MKTKQDIRYYFFSFSNFIAALGGGMILGKGVGIIDQPFLKGGSVLAFFVGTILGLAFLQMIPKKISQSIARWFSILAAITALILLYIFNVYSVNTKLIDIPAVIFFAFLSIRFGFWFYSRVLRASLAAGQQQKIAWVELGYYAGMIGGLIIWSFLGIEISIATALIIDAALQFSAGIIDLFMGKSTLPLNKNINSPNSNEITHIESVWSWQLAGSVVFLTIGIQVVIFSLAHQVSPYFTSFILAFYYLGAAIGAVFCKKFNILLAWNNVTSNKNSYAKVFLNTKTGSRGMSFIIHGMLSSFCLGIAICGVVYWQWGNKSMVTENVFELGEMLLLLLVVASAFFYEILALAILDRMGLEEQGSNRNMLMRTYGLMGIGAAISLWMLSMSKNSVSSLFFTLFICVAFSVFLTKRKQIQPIGQIM